MKRFMSKTVRTKDLNVKNTTHDTLILHFSTSPFHNQGQDSQTVTQKPTLADWRLWRGSSLPTASATHCQKPNLLALVLWIDLHKFNDFFHELWYKDLHNFFTNSFLEAFWSTTTIISTNYSVNGSTGTPTICSTTRSDTHPCNIAITISTICSWICGVTNVPTIAKIRCTMRTCQTTVTKRNETVCNRRTIFH